MQEVIDITIKELKELKEQYKVQHETYEQSKVHYAEQQLPYSLILLEQLGGGVGDANWTYTSDIPIDASDEENIVPITPEGKRFHFIAEVPTYHYCDNGADNIVLFYEPDSRTAVLTFDWT